jgi:hypothetical protein
VSVSRRFLRGLFGLGAAALALTACTAAPPGAEPTPDRPSELGGWQQVALPGGMTPSTVEAAGSELWVGGFLGAGVDRSPALARGSTGGRELGWRSVPLRARTPYGRVARLVSVTGDGRSVVTLGAAHGGAHANSRWTVWSGTAAGVVERPQTFETFGGLEAGGLLDVARDRGGPLIVGTWQGEYGLDAAIWRAAGERWVRQPTPPALANTAGQQVAPRSAAAQPDGTVVIDGALIDLTDGVRQSAAVWRGSGSDWRRSLLADPGRRSEAWSTACAATGPAPCWTVGARDGVVAVWSTDARARLPELTVGDADTGVIALHDDRVVAAVSTNGQGRLLVGHDGAWRLYTAPAGIVRAAALAGTRLYLVSGPQSSAVLSVRDIADLLAG